MAWPVFLIFRLLFEFSLKNMFRVKKVSWKTIVWKTRPDPWLPFGVSNETIKEIDPVFSCLTPLQLCEKAIILLEGSAAQSSGEDNSSTLRDDLATAYMWRYLLTDIDPQQVGTARKCLWQEYFGIPVPFSVTYTPNTACLKWIRVFTSDHLTQRVPSERHTMSYFLHPENQSVHLILLGSGFTMFEWAYLHMHSGLLYIYFCLPPLPVFLCLEQD